MTLLTDEDMHKCYESARQAYKHTQSQIRGQMFGPADDPDYHLVRAIEAAVLAKLQAQEPVAEIFWTDENPEWQLKMLVEPSCPAGERIKVYSGEYQGFPLLYVDTESAPVQQDAPEVGFGNTQTNQLLENFDELEAELGDLPQAQAELLTKIKELEAQNAKLVEALKNVTVHLIAAHSLLQEGGKKAAASDKIFKIMLDDYEKSFEVGRAALVEVKK